jgi:hypothetical protein
MRSLWHERVLFLSKRTLDRGDRRVASAPRSQLVRPRTGSVVHPAIVANVHEGVLPELRLASRVERLRPFLLRQALAMPDAPETFTCPECGWKTFSHRHSDRVWSAELGQVWHDMAPYRIRSRPSPFQIVTPMTGAAGAGS